MADKQFWTNSAATMDPKRGFRFKISFEKLGSHLWFAKKCDRPTLSFTETKHDYLNHSFYWPARAEWNEVTMTLVDPVEPDIATSLLTFIKGAGYDIPTGADGNLTSMSKFKATENTGPVVIQMINEAGTPIEFWKLNKAWIKEVDFSEVDYSNDDLSEVTVKLRYDWATFSKAGQGGEIFQGP